MRTVLPDHKLIAPAELAGVAVALQEAASEGKCVLWLDELQDFLGPDGLTLGQSRSLCSDPVIIG